MALIGTQTLYDPDSGQWFTYTPGSTVPASGGEAGGPETVTQPSMVPISGPSQNAHDIAATLLQSEFTSWETQFKPIEQAAMQQLSFNNPSVLPTAIGEAKEAATGESKAMSGILERQNKSRGIQPTEEQEAASKRILDLTQALNVAGAENTARQNVRTQDEQILLGGVPNPNVVKGASTS